MIIYFFICYENRWVSNTQLPPFKVEAIAIYKNNFTMDEYLYDITYQIKYSCDYSFMKKYE